MPLRRLFQRLSAAALLVGLSTAVGEAQTCVQMAEFDSMAAGVIQMVRSYTTPADSAYNAYRIGLGYPLVAASQVTLVSKEQDCKKARDLFNAKLPTGSGRTNRVVVVKAGSTYTVIDPGYVFNASTPRRTYVLMNGQFKFVSFLGG